MSEYKMLESPIRINKMWLRNRIAFPPINECQSNENGAPTDAMCAYYAERAKGGAALVTVGSTTITPESRNHGAQGQMSDPKYVPPYSHLVDWIHRYGAKASIELNHFGAEASIPGSRPNPSASNVCARDKREIRALTLDEIMELQQQYVNAVLLAKKAGFDAVTFHAAHGNIMPQFFSTLYNKRTDWYGGSFENRVRFAREIVEMTRAAVGPNYPLIMRISGDEYIAGGRTLEETVEICKVMETAGIDCFDVSGGLQATYMYSIMPGNLPGIDGFMMPSAKAIKEAVSVPVIGAGGLRTPERGEQLLEDGWADMISFGRAQIVDPMFVQKAFSGRADEIRPCLSCLYCFQRTGKDQFLACAVNPEAGRELMFTSTVKPSEKSKKILVVGGGPAGCTAAITLAKRGHSVELIDANPYLGGSVYAAGIPQHKEPMHKLVNWYEKQLKDLGIKYSLNTKYTKEMSQGFDIVMDAVGASYARFIKGSTGSNVMTAIEALTHPEKVGEKVVVIGGGNTGCEVAEYFGAREYNFTTHRMKNFEMEMEIVVTHDASEHNKDVTLVEMMPQLCPEREGFSRRLLMKQLEINNVRRMVSTKVRQVLDGCVEVVDMKAGDLVSLEADTVILAGGMKPEGIETADGVKHIKIGDAEFPSTIANATFSAYCRAVEI